MSVDGSRSLKPRRAANPRRPSHLVLSGLDDGRTAMQLLMDSRKLLYLATVVEQGSLNKAAKRLDVSQPALSKAMDRLEDGLGVKLLFGLLRGDFDFVIAQTEFYNILDGLRQRVIFRDRLRVFARPKHRLFRVADPTWADLAQFPWVCPMVGGRQRTVLEKLLASEGIELPQQLIECGSIDFTKALVACSDHLAMLPEHAVTSHPGKSKLKPLRITVPALSRDIAVIFRD